MLVPRLCNYLMNGSRETVARLLLPDTRMLNPTMSAVHLEQFRCRKRALKKPLSKQQRLERRLKREEKEAKRKQYSFMQRIQIMRMRKMLSPSEQHPGRYDADAEANLPENPLCDVFLHGEQKTQFYTIAEALAKHRTLQSPSMFNNPGGMVRVRFELNMNTEKATKTVPNSDEIVPIPFSFKHNEKRTILAFANSKENQDLAVEAGAEIAVGPEAVKKILKGQFIITDYDFCVCHVDAALAITPLRGLLRSKFPTVNNGALGSDFNEIIQRFMTGVKLSIKADPVRPFWGLAEPNVGLLNMTDEEIEANIEAIIAALCKHRSPALGPFINRATMAILPHKTYFSLNVDKHVPVATVDEVEKLDKQKKRKKAKKESAKPAGPEVVHDDDYLVTLM